MNTNDAPRSLPARIMGWVAVIVTAYLTAVNTVYIGAGFFYGGVWNHKLACALVIVGLAGTWRCIFILLNHPMTRSKRIGVYLMWLLTTFALFGSPFSGKGASHTMLDRPTKIPSGEADSPR